MNVCKENWRPLIYHGRLIGRFEISTSGKIKNAHTGRNLKTCITPAGYEAVCVSLGSRKNKLLIRVHRAVAETFLPNIDNKPIVNHIDGNKRNNHLKNLEWCTASENTIHAYANGLRQPLTRQQNANTKLSKNDIRFICSNYIPSNKEFGARALGKRFGVYHSSILDVIKHKDYLLNTDA